MHDWNVVVTFRDGAQRPARKLLEELGWLDRTYYPRVFVMAVDDVAALPARLQAGLVAHPEVARLVGRVVPLTMVFDFRTPEEFRNRLRQAALELAPPLERKRFHVRMHRRGFKGRLTSPEEERALDDALLDWLRSHGGGQIDFEHPDAVVVVETVDNRAGVALVTREHMARYAFLRVD